MSKKIDLNKTVFELTEQYPELIDIMASLGFTEITKKAVLNSVGKIMTIPKGAKMKHISMMDVVTTLMANGFELEGTMPDIKVSETAPSAPASSVQPSDEQTEQLKAYLRRLGDGEDLESVRADFVRDFSDVDPSAIMRAEQELMREGTPLAQVQRLCDIHSALFHGKTREEQIANAEKAVNESLKQQRIQEQLAKRDAFPKKDYTDKNAKAAALEAVNGHPLHTLTAENNALSTLLEEYKKTSDGSLIARIRELSIHYAKKGDLLYPLLKVKYGITGPSDVMWTVDDEIRDELGALAKETNHDEAWITRMDAAVKRAEEMIYKEQNILFPICAVNFSEQEWYGIYRDSKDYADCLSVTKESWPEAEAAAPWLHPFREKL